MTLRRNFMTLKDILKLVCEFVNEKEIVSKWENNESLTTKQSEKVGRMVKCFNLVNQEIASDFLPFLFEEAVNVTNGVLSYSTLTKNVINIYQLKDSLGRSLEFRNFPNYVEVKGVAKKVIYSFLPDELGLNDNVPTARGLTARVYAYGVACEYLLLEGFGSDAEIWEERFKESLFVLSRKRGEHRLPKRRFI